MFDDVDDLDRLVRTLQKPLPISFRVSRVASRQDLVNNELHLAHAFLEVWYPVNYYSWLVVAENI